MWRSAACGAAVAAGTIILAQRWSRRRCEDAEDAAFEGVLRFWFEGDGTSDLYATRWFVPPGSAALHRLDEEVRARFGATLGRAERGELDHWAASARGCLALVLLLDQLSRHAHRGDGGAVLANDARALVLAERLLARGWHTQLRAAELVFALMPLRHSPTAERLEQAMDLTGAALRTREAEAATLARFRRATELRLQHLQGDGDPHDILERDDREAALDQTGAASEPLAATVERFLRDTAFCDADGTPPPPPPSAQTDSGDRVVSAAKRCEAERPRDGAGGAAADAAAADATRAARDDEALIVSLSGGVDSMVLAHVLLRLQPRHRRRVCAVHIDYTNRAESGAEAAFLQRWCAARGVPLRVRTVEEVRRGATSRDEYEKVSRAVRFDAYRQALAQFGGRAVLFGHHLGDVHENVISNVMKGASLLNIAGISTASAVNGVLIWRPMLPHPKSLLYDYAHRYGVPYFKDSTPGWSTRGRLRNQLQPLLAEVYGEGYSTHLSALARDSALCSELIDSQLYAPFRSSLRRSPLAVWFDAAGRAALPLFFWREALRHVCEKELGIGLVGEKAVLQLLERLRAPRVREGWLALRKESRVLLAAGTLAFLRPSVFPGARRGRGLIGAQLARGGAGWGGAGRGAGGGGGMRRGSPSPSRRAPSLAPRRRPPRGASLGPHAAHAAGRGGAGAARRRG